MSLAAKLHLLGALTLSIASANSLIVVNPNFSAIAVQCGTGYAYQQFYAAGDCAGPDAPQQNFNGELGIGWTFGKYVTGGTGAGLTKPNTAFDPPPFTGLPFSQAALLQQSGSGSVIAQTVAGFVPGGLYTLSFYLGSRYASQPTYDGNQTVQATIDNQVIGTWPLVSFTPFTLQTVTFTVTSGGPLTLKFAGLASGDHTAFLSGVSIETSSSLTVNPASGFPGIRIAVSGSGFVPFETVDLIGYASVPAVIGTATASASGNATVDGQIPPTPFGTYGMEALGESSGTVAPGTISIAPRLLISPTTGTIGETVTVTGFGFAAGEEVNVNWLSPQTLLGTTTTNAAGSFPALTFDIPSGAPVGYNAVIATGQRSGATAKALIIVQ